MRSIRASAVTALLIVACAEGPQPAGQIPAYTGQHPIDRVLYPVYAAEAYTPTSAPREVLCRRLMIDLLGRSPSLDELASECGQRSVEEIARDFQSRPEYLLVSERHFRDQLSGGETYVDWRYLKDLYARIDALSSSRLRYDTFARQTLSHPGFMLSEEGDGRVRLAFNAFAGRPPTAGETHELVALYRPWDVEELTDPDFRYALLYRGIFDPESCYYLGGCSTTLYGGASIELDQAAELVSYERMTPAEVEAAQAIGRLLTAQPFFYEAAADELLDRLLGWSDGGRTPRRPGSIFPEVRRVLADFLKETGDYPAAERLVLTSWLYTQPSEATTAEAPVYQSGPLKPMSAEVWLDTLLRLVGQDLGTCDVRYLGNDSEFIIADAFEEGLIDEATYQRDTRKLHGMMEDRRPLGAEGPDEAYRDTVSLIGGCPLVGAERIAPYGLAYGYKQEGLANALCSQGFASSGAREVRTALAEQMPRLLGREAGAEDLADFEAAFAGCSAEDCAPEAVAAAVCTALAGSAELLFY